MSFRVKITALLGVLASIATFVWWTSRTLPDVVASHFSLSGAADGFSPRGDYVATMIALVVLVPLLPALLPGALLRGGAGLNLPDREYWLAPEQKDATLAYVRTHGLWLAVALSLFLAYVHWLTVEANARKPPVLSRGGFLAGLSVFLALTAGWVTVLFARFRRP
jgi:hypothetical protein